MNQKSNLELLRLLVGNDMARHLASLPLAEVFGFSKPRQQQLCEEMAPYVTHPSLSAAKELLARCFSEQLSTCATSLTSPTVVKSFLCTQIGHLEYESFWCLWMDAQNRLVMAEEAFRGSVTQTSVYPREIVKRALALNAVGVIFAHNHPSGVLEPSSADQALTSQLKSALALVDVRTLDHFIVGGNNAVSFSEKGLMW